MIWDMRFIKFFLLCIFPVVLYAQNNDCTNAIELSDTIYTVKEPTKGFGKIKELVQTNPKNKKAFRTENNSSWFMLKQSKKVNLTFSIIPHNINDDYDFMIFDAATNNFCDSSLFLNKVKPLRSNISRNDKNLESKTGLDNKSDSLFIGAGVGSSFSKSLEMEANKSYMLVICNDKYALSGYTLKLNYTPVKSNNPENDSLLARLEQELKKNRNKLEFVFADSDTKTVIESDVVIRTPQIDTGFVISGNANYTVPLKSNTDIMAIATGYMIEKRNYFVPVDSIAIQDTIYLHKIVNNAYLEIIPFYFEGNTNKLLPKSNPALLSLLLFLQKNPEVKIEIQGHANGPKRKNLKEFRKLSEERAEAIKKYLTFNGVRKKRLHIEGFGNSMMLFPDPQTEEESELNRRVEIKIIAID